MNRDQIQINNKAPNKVPNKSELAILKLLSDIPRLTLTNNYLAGGILWSERFYLVHSY